MMDADAVLKRFEESPEGKISRMRRLDINEKQAQIIAFCESGGAKCESVVKSEIPRYVRATFRHKDKTFVVYISKYGDAFYEDKEKIEKLKHKRFRRTKEEVNECASAVYLGYLGYKDEMDKWIDEFIKNQDRDRECLRSMEDHYSPISYEVGRQIKKTTLPASDS